MNSLSILKRNDHRPWPIPGSKWNFYQQWNKVLFLHWKIRPAKLRSFLPEGLVIDLFEGEAWVSAVAFSMDQVRPRNLPPFPPISNFHELNIRTYVRYGDKAGVYFLSIEAGKRLSSFLAKNISGLPYRYSKMERKGELYISNNGLQKECFSAKYKPGTAILEKTALDVWLTERYAVFHDIRNQIITYEVHHPEWPIQKVELENLSLDYPRFNVLLESDPDRIHYSPGVEVLTFPATQ